MAKTPDTLDSAFEQICQELLGVFLQKHQDYGKGNILSIKELGIAIRISEKTERLKHLLLKQELDSSSIANESIADSWTDVAVYAIIARLYRNGQFQALDVKDSKIKRKSD